MIDYERLYAIIGSRDYALGIRPDSILIDLGDAFLLAHRGRGRYAVQHVWGPPRRWRALFKGLAEELIRRGEGDTPVHWKTGGPVARLAGRLLPVRIVDDPEVPGLRVAEYTANEAIRVL